MSKRAKGLRSTLTELRWLHPNLVTSMTLSWTMQPISLLAQAGDAASLATQDSNFKTRWNLYRPELCSWLWCLCFWTRMKTDIDLAFWRKPGPLAELCFHKPNVHTPASLGFAVRQKKKSRTAYFSSSNVAHISIEWKLSIMKAHLHSLPYANIRTTQCVFGLIIKHLQLCMYAVLF